MIKTINYNIGIFGNETLGFGNLIFLLSKFCNNKFNSTHLIVNNSNTANYIKKNINSFDKVSVYPISLVKYQNNNSIYSLKNSGELTHSIIEQSNCIIALPGNNDVLQEILCVIQYLKNNNTESKVFFIHDFWEKTFEYLKENNIISNTDYNLLRFFCNGQSKNIINKIEQFIPKQKTREISSKHIINNYTEISDLEDSIYKILNTGEKVDDSILGINISIFDKYDNEYLKLEQIHSNDYKKIINSCLDSDKSVLQLNNGTELLIKNTHTRKNKSFNNVESNLTNFNEFVSCLEENGVYGTFILNNIKNNERYKVSVLVAININLPEILELRLISLIKNFTSAVYEKYMHKDLNEDIESANITSAIARVFLRTASHNMGHVYSKLVSKDNFKHEVINTDTQYKSLLFPNFINDSNDIYRILLANFNSYLKSRSDFLADFVTGVPQIQNTKKLKVDILSIFDNNRILLNRISGLGNEFKFSIKLNLPNNKDDISVAISNDILGNHALYIIIENIIRNSAKHNQSDKKHEIEFVIDVCESSLDKSYYKIRIYDNIKLNTLKQKVIELNKIIDSPIITNDFKHRYNGLGMIEMMVSAAYLRKIPVESVHKSEYNLIFDKVKIKEYQNNVKKGITPLKIFRAIQIKNYLGYEFYIPKPKELLIIDDDGYIINNYIKDNIIDWDQIKNLEAQGILLVSNKNIKSDKLNRLKFNSKTNYDHNICVIFTSNSNYKEYEKNVWLPTRKVVGNELNCNFDAGNINQFIKNVWICYVTQFYNRKKLIPIPNSDLLNLNGNNNYPYSLFNHGNSYTGNNDLNYLEIYLSKHKSIVENIESGTDDILNLKFLNALTTNIIVIEERIQEQSLLTQSLQNNKIKPQISYYEYWNNVNVYIPTKEELDLNRSSFKPNKTDDENYISKIANIANREFNEEKRLSKGVDFVLIHLGVIERILIAQNKEKGSKEVEKIINSIKRKITDNNNVKFVIISGRGKPENVPNNIRFINYSIISQYLIENRFKLFLSEILYASKPKK